MASPPLPIGLRSLLTATLFQLCGRQVARPSGRWQAAQDQSSPGMLCMVMARMSRAILLQLLTPGCPEFPCTGPEGAAPSGKSVAASFFLWYTSPFSRLSVGKNGEAGAVKMCTLTSGQAAARGSLQAWDRPTCRLSWAKRLLTAWPLLWIVIQRALRSQTVCAKTPYRGAPRWGKEHRLGDGGHHFYFRTRPHSR